ncbi:MAG: VanZ family protein, partial [Bifidobacteriaceae bacterium]|nr:VanZ family protein [Bifidobacteriaceae bacterium]
MANAVLPALVAVILGLAVALIAFGPFVALAYRRYRHLTWRYVFGWLGFAIYFLAIWAYALLPFPSPGQFKCVRPQLVPLFSVRDAFNYPHGSLGQLLHNPVLVQVGLNVILFVPLGLFVRALWGRGLIVTLAVALGWSFFVETTQLTGVWGVYGCAYRVFDVDDLIANTSGGLLGGVMALALPRGWLSPEAQPPGQPAPVTKGRRVVAMACDGLSVWFIAAVGGLLAQRLAPGQSSAAWSDWGTIWLPFAVQALSVALTGRTLGDLATMLRWEPGRPAWLWRRLTRLLGGI